MSDSALVKKGSSMRKQDAVLIVAMAFVLAAPSVALAYKKKASGENLSHEQMQQIYWSYTQQRSSSHIVQQAAFTVTTVGKSGGYK